MFHVASLSVPGFRGGKVMVVGNTLFVGCLLSGSATLACFIGLERSSSSAEDALRLLNESSRSGIVEGCKSLSCQIRSYGPLRCEILGKDKVCG